MVNCDLQYPTELMSQFYPRVKDILVTINIINNEKIIHNVIEIATVLKENFLPKSKVGRASFWYLSGSSASFPCHKLFHAKTTAITHGPSTIWFNKTCKKQQSWECSNKFFKIKCSTESSSQILKENFIPLSTRSVLIALACNDQETGTKHENQGHTKETHMKSFGELEASCGLKVGSASHSQGAFVVT